VAISGEECRRREPSGAGPDDAYPQVLHDARDNSDAADSRRWIATAPAALTLFRGRE
jgi:hypothetical protein